MTSRNNTMVLAVKRIGIQSGTREAYQNNQLTLRDNNVAKKSRDCQLTVDFYESMFYTDCIWILMERMDTSLDKFYKKAHENSIFVPERFVENLVFSLVEALKLI